MISGNVSENDTTLYLSENWKGFVMRNLNIKDIAKLAGVGVSTVSRVINEHPDVKDDTRQRVMEIIETYNYIPNNSARNLKRLDTNHVGILVKGMFNPFFAQMVEVIEKKLTHEQYASVLHYNREGLKDVDAAHEFIMEKKLKGVICLGGDFDEMSESDIKRLRVPVILASTELPEQLDKTLYSSVLIDNEKAAFEAVSSLCQMGHRKIGIITSGEGDRSIGKKRTEGYLRALENHGIEKIERYFELGDYSFEKGYEAMKRLLDKAPDISAVFAISDIMAIGASKAILESGRRIPEDISVVGFDDIDYAAYFNPPLTTVHQPVRSMAEKTADIIISILDEQKPHEHVVFDTRIIARSSAKEV